MRFGRVTNEQIYFGRAEILRVYIYHFGVIGNTFAYSTEVLFAYFFAENRSVYCSDIAFFVYAFAFKFDSETYFSGSHCDKIANGGSDTCSNYIITRGRLLQDEVHRLDIVFGVPPVALRAEVTHIELILHTQRYPAESTGYLAGYKSFTAYRRFVVEEDTIRGVHIIGFAVIYSNPIGIQFSDCIRRTRIERSALTLRYFLYQTVKFRSRSLIDTRFFGKP